MADAGYMKRQEFAPCLHCGKGMMHAGSPIFYRVRIEQFAIDLNAVRRAAGLEMMLGSQHLAAALGPDENLAKRLFDRSGLLCLNCAMEAYFASLIENAPD